MLFCRLAGTCARLASIAIARYVTPTKMLLAAVHGQLAFSLACAFIGVNYQSSLWVLAPLLGCFREVLWPLGYAWADHYIILFGVIVGLSNMAVMLCNIGQDPLQGWLYDHTVIESIFYTTVVYALLQCLLAYAMTYYASRRGSRKQRERLRVAEQTQMHLKKCVR